MKKLLNTLYISSPDTYLSLDGENVVLSKERQEITRVPLHNIESIVTLGYSGMSPALLGKCADNSIGVSFLSRSGRFLANVVGSYCGNVILRKTQYKLSDDENACTEIARNMIAGKLYNSRWVIERATRDYPNSLDINKLKSVSAKLKDSIANLNDCKNTEQLRGIEGEAATRYFSVFNDLIYNKRRTLFLMEETEDLQQTELMLCYHFRIHCLQI